MDWAILEFLAAPFAAALVIAGLHAYLGLHVVERGVIFVDLSLAQIAALGATIAVLLQSGGADPHAVIEAGVVAEQPLTPDHSAAGVYWMSLAFTIGGALIFALVKGHKARVPQEAIIGISYAVASAGVIVAMSQSPGESEHLRDMLVGNILAVQWADVWETAALYLVIGAFHYVFRKRFLEISTDPQGAESRGVAVRFWDFLFYASFGVMVTRSVAIAGVLLVFCYLIVPSVAGMLFSTRVGPRLAIAWLVAAFVSGLGMYFSVQFDYPTGAAIVCTFGLVLVVLAAVRSLLAAAGKQA